MLSRSRQTRTRVHQICDGALFALALVLAYFLRDGLARIDALGLSPLEPFSEIIWLPPVAAVLGPVFLQARGFYRHNGARIFPAVAAAALTALSLVILLFLLRMQIARSVILLGCGLGGALAYVRDAFVARLSATRLANEQWRERILWLGDTAANNEHRATLSPDETAHITDLGDFDPLANTPGCFAKILHASSVNTVIMNLPAQTTTPPLPSLQAYLDCCAREGVSVVIRTGLKTAGPTVESLGGETVVHIRAAHRASPGRLALKRAIDIAAAAAALIVLAPLFVCIALAIKLTSRGPVLFRQTRAGLNGRPFTMLKFRTMRVGAENELASLASQNEMGGPAFKISDDPRLAPCGRFLRRHSLDEFPQLWNVLRGEMSLVGPRPLPDYEVARFDNDAHRRRQSMRPGLTCLWQISGRNDIADFAEWMRLDLAYIDTWSPWLDARIVLATIPVVLFGKGGR